MKRLFGLEFKVFGVLAGLAMVAATTLGFMIYALDQGRTNQHLGNQLAELNTLSSSIFRRSEQYLAFAPRSYEAYNRDLVVFYQDFRRDLELLDTLVTGITEEYYRRIPTRISEELGIGLRTERLDHSFNQMTMMWQEFYTGLKLKLGDNPAEPRLEWGTEYIRDNQSTLQKVMQHSITTVNDEIGRQAEHMEHASYIAMAILAIMAFSGLAWFYFGVTHRIKSAVDGCVRVASGDFGYQINASGRDEIGTLGHAINNLSMRARLVFAMADNLRSAKQQKAALNDVWIESKALYSLVWMGLYKLHDELEYMQLVNAQPRSWAKMLNRQDIRVQQTPMQVIQLQKPLLIEDMDDFTKRHPTERLIRGMTLKIVNSRSCLVLPIVHGGDTTGLLVLVSERRDAFSKEDIELLTNLAPLFGEMFGMEMPVEQFDDDEDGVMPGKKGLASA